MNSLFVRFFPAFLILFGSAASAQEWMYDFENSRPLTTPLTTELISERIYINVDGGVNMLQPEHFEPGLIYVRYFAIEGYFAIEDRHFRRLQFANFYALDDWREFIGYETCQTAPIAWNSMSEQVLREMRVMCARVVPCELRQRENTFYC